MNEAMYSLRILSKGKITDLTKGFDLNGVPFSIYVCPKKATMEQNTLVKCKLIRDKEVGDFPVPLWDWTPGLIVEISPNAINLAENDVYWGAGE